MFLVVDANILFSFFNPDSSRRKIIESSSKLGFKLISPEFAFEELLNDKEKIQEYCKIDEIEFIIFFSLLEKRIESISKSEYDRFLSKAIELAPHIKDAPYFAPALLLNCPIWSDEKLFKRQDEVKIFNTKELSRLYEKSLNKRDKSNDG